MKRAATQQIELRSPIQAPFDRLQPRDPAFRLSVGPFESTSRADRRFVPANLVGELLNLTDTGCLCVGKPLTQFGPLALSDYSHEPFGETDGDADVRVDIP